MNLLLHGYRTKKKDKVTGRMREFYRETRSPGWNVVDVSGFIRQIACIPGRGCNSL
jgi:hypothetical protein